MYFFLSQIADFIGFLGVILLILAYFSVSIDWISAKSLLYQILNFTAACLLLFSLYFHWNTPSVIIEIVWILISMTGMFRILWLKSYHPK